MSKSPVRVAVTGAAGQIGYALLFRIASGQMLGPDQPVILQLLEIPDEKAQKALKGVIMELDDCAFPLLAGIDAARRPDDRFKDANVALLVGARPRGPGMERKDLLAPTPRFSRPRARRSTRSPRATSRCWWSATRPTPTPHRDEERAGPAGQNFTAMLRLDHNRALSQLAAKTGKHVGDIEKMIIWGNHSPTMYPDFRFATVDGKAGRRTLINDQEWNDETFMPTVGKRGAAIIEARGASSAASAANAAIDHMHDWVLGTNGKWITMGVPSDGSYGIPKASCSASR